MIHLDFNAMGRLRRVATNTKGGFGRLLFWQRLPLNATRSLVCICMLPMLTILLAACTHEGGALIFSNLALGAGETGTVTLNAAEMGQFNSLQVGPKGRIIYDPAVVQVLNVEGASGFIVFASDVDNLTGEVTLAAGSTSGAVPNGPVIALTVRAVGAPGDSTTINITQLDFVVKTNDDPIPGVTVTAGQITIN